MTPILLFLLTACAVPPDGSPSPRGLDPGRTGLQQVLAPRGGAVGSLAFGPDGRRLAVGCARGVLVYEGRGWKPLGFLEGSGSVVHSLAWSPDGDRIAGGTLDGAILVWNVTGPGKARTLAGHEAHVSGLEWSRDGRRLLSGSLDGTARLWDAGEGRLLRILGRPDASLLAVRFEDGDRRVRAVLGNNLVRLWDAESGAELSVQKGLPGLLSAAAFSRAGDLACGTGAGDLRLRRLDGDGTERILPIEEGSGAAVGGLAFTPDGKHLLSVTHEAGIRVRRVSDGKLLASLTPGPGVLEAVAVAPDGRSFATCGQDRWVRLWGPRPPGAARVRAPGFCGLRVEPAGADGVRISEVLADSPAAGVGVRAGDLLRAVDGETLEGTNDAVDLIGRRFQGEEILLSVERAGVPLDLRVVLAARDGR
jgi:WD40 repeat protein